MRAGSWVKFCTADRFPVVVHPRQLRSRPHPSPTGIAGHAAALPIGVERIDVAIIGAGQAGLSAAGTLVRRGLTPGQDFLVLDANGGPGGAWRHRWKSLTFGSAHGIHDLPGFPMEEPDPTEPARDLVPRYYGAFEEHLDLGVIRPAPVGTVERDDDGDFLISFAPGPHGVREPIRARTVINGTGTWGAPYLPYYPGMADFGGRQLHTRDFVAAEEFAGQRVLVVGGGTSAAQFLLMLRDAGAQTVWSTRRTPDWTQRVFDSEWGRDVESAVSTRTTAGIPPASVVSVTGLPSTPGYLRGIAEGTLLSRGPLVRLTGRGAVLDGPGPYGTTLATQGPVGDVQVNAVPQLPGRPATLGNGETTGWEVELDAVLWATGFRADLRHLAPLKVRASSGGVKMHPDTVSVAGQPGLFLVGYGASASTLGATRAGRKAAVRALRHLRDTATASEARLA